MSTRPTLLRGWLLPAVIVGVIAAVVGAGLALTGDLEAIGPGSRAPTFTATDVRTGRAVAPEDYGGEVILLNVWATWCRPCETEMPSLQRLHEALGPRGLRILAVSIDKGEAAPVRRWIEERGLEFTVLHDPAGAIERIYQTTGVPETFVIDRTGIIVKRDIGAREWDAPSQVRLLESLLSTRRADTAPPGDRR